METEYDVKAKVFKALSDPNRIKIVDMLSCGEKCACEILESFEFTHAYIISSYESAYRV